MKKIITVLATMLFVAGIYCQSSLSFCANVEKDGACDFGNTKFISAPDSSLNKLFMRVKSDSATLGVSRVTFKVYSIQKGGVEKLDVEFPLTVQPDWMYAWQPCLFPTGKYVVRAFNEANKLMCSQTLEFFDWKRF